MVRPNPRYGDGGFSYSTEEEERDRLKFQQLDNRVQELRDKKQNLFQAVTEELPSWFNNPHLQPSPNEKRDWLNARIEYLTAIRDVNRAKCFAGKGGNEPYCGNWNENIGKIEQMKRELNKIQGEPLTFPSFDIFPSASAEVQQLSLGISQPILAEDVSPLPPSTKFNETITDSMITQRLNNFSIINGRAVGNITFTATVNFNPFYYGKNITNLIQFQTPNGVNILPTIKQNNLRFTETERTETIHYDEFMEGNTRATLESFVWSSAIQPTPFSKKISYEISERTEPKPIAIHGIMGAGVAGAIGILILLGFIADHKRGK
tara:strand:- start:6 stop:965 length:960 start_codon:yes stop_codon:yes gene_type:complete